MPFSGNVTDEGYWDQRWQQFCRIYKVSRYDRLWGPKGSFMRVISRYVGSVEDMRIIELGGAASYFSLALTKWGKAKVVLIDYSEIGLEKTKEIYARNSCPVETVKADFFNWDPGKGKFDLVVHWGLLEHFADPAMILRICKDLLRPGGKIIFSMPNMEAWGASFWRKLSPDDWQRHIHHSVEDIKKACGSVGLEMKEVFYWGPPLVQIAPCKRGEFIKLLLTLIHYGFTFLGMVVPMYHYGLRKISVHRGFVLSKPLQTDE